MKKYTTSLSEDMKRPVFSIERTWLRRVNIIVAVPVFTLMGLLTLDFKGIGDILKSAKENW